MITVAIIAVLAAIAVPAFTKESRKSKAMSEVGAMFAELGVREDQYKAENTGYLAAAACPASPVAAGQDATSCIGAGGEWEALRVRLPETNLRCSYVITTGTGTGATPPTGFTFVSPPGNWYYIVATCDMDNDGTSSYYFTSSTNSRIQPQNDGE